MFFTTTLYGTRYNRLYCVYMVACSMGNAFYDVLLEYSPQRPRQILQVVSKPVNSGQLVRFRAVTFNTFK